MKQPKLSIIIPAYQEAARIEKSLDQLAIYLRRHNHTDTEVVVVVADSPDGTAALVRAKAQLFTNLRVIDAGPRVGKGRDVRTGMMEATGSYKLFMDADLATPLHYIQNLYALIEQGSEVIIAVRNLHNSHTGIRKLISSLGNWLVRTVLLPGIYDTQCGFKAFSATAAEKLFRRQTIVGWGFDMEILAIAGLQGYKITQITVPDWSDKPNGSFDNDAITGAAVETFGELAKIVWKRWTGGYRHKRFTYEPYKP